jgi:hypothetical protein
MKQDLPFIYPDAFEDEGIEGKFRKCWRPMECESSRMLSSLRSLKTERRVSKQSFSSSSISQMRKKTRMRWVTSRRSPKARAQTWVAMTPELEMMIMRIKKMESRRLTSSSTGRRERRTSSS